MNIWGERAFLAEGRASANAQMVGKEPGVLEAQKEVNERGQSAGHRGGWEKVRCAGKGWIVKVMVRYLDSILCPREGFTLFLSSYGRYFMG